MVRKVDGSNHLGAACTLDLVPVNEQQRAELRRVARSWRDECEENLGGEFSWVSLVTVGADVAEDSSRARVQSVKLGRSVESG